MISAGDEKQAHSGGALPAHGKIHGPLRDTISQRARLFSGPSTRAGYDIRTIQELLGHKDVKTAMISTHVLNRGGTGVRSPADLLKNQRQGLRRKPHNP